MKHDDPIRIAKDKKKFTFYIAILITWVRQRSKVQEGTGFWNRRASCLFFFFFFHLKGKYTQKNNPNPEKKKSQSHAQDTF